MFNVKTLNSTVPNEAYFTRQAQTGRVAQNGLGDNCLRNKCMLQLGLIMWYWVQIMGSGNFVNEGHEVTRRILKILVFLRINSWINEPDEIYAH